MSRAKERCEREKLLDLTNWKNIQIRNNSSSFNLKDSRQCCWATTNRSGISLSNFSFFFFPKNSSYKKQFSQSTWWIQVNGRSPVDRSPWKKFIRKRSFSHDSSSSFFFNPGQCRRTRLHQSWRLVDAAADTHLQNGTLRLWTIDRRRERERKTFKLWGFCFSFG